MGQEVDSLQIKTQELSNKAKESVGAKKLEWLDSIARLSQNDPKLNYESHVHRVVNYALEIDSVDMAAFHTSQLIFYLANRAGKPKEGIQVFDRFLAKNLEIKDPDINAQLYLNGGDSYFFGGETASSIPLYKSAGMYALEAGDSLLLGRSKNYTSDAYADTGRFAEAGAILSESEVIFESMKDTFNLLTTRNSRANLYSRIGFFEEAAKIRAEIVSLAEKREDYRMLQSTLYNASIDSRKVRDDKNWIAYLKRALYFAEKGNLKSYEPKILISLLRAYSLSDSLQKARQVYNRIQEDKERYQQGLDGAHYDEAIACYEFTRGNYKEAINIAEGLLSAESSKDFGNAERLHKFLTEAYETVNNQEKAHYHHKKYAALRDSISNIQNVRALTYYQTLYETKKRDATIDAQNAEIALLDVENEMKKQWIILGSIGLVAFFLIVFFLRSRQAAKNKKLLLEGFSQELIKAQEGERSRVARELHDSVGQKLILLTKKTNVFADDQTDALASSTLDELRTISRGLHPSNIEKLGISKALEDLVNQADASTDIFFTHEIDNIDPKLHPETALHVYRIVQEAINNMIKHSETRSALVQVKERESHIDISIEDKGKGFVFTDALRSGESMGMRTLLERTKIIRSKLEVISAPNQGTIIQLRVPVI